MVAPDNDLKRFLLTWMDLNGLAAAPGLVISTACSSGVTRIGSGGSQLAMEQALFSAGASAIVSGTPNQ